MLSPVAGPEQEAIAAGRSQFTDTEAALSPSAAGTPTVERLITAGPIDATATARQQLVPRR
jgi:hypothetical protein